MMNRQYLLLAMIGYLSANSMVLLESYENNYILQWTTPVEAFQLLFINRITTIFAIDLLFVVLVFFIWAHFKSKRPGMKKTWPYWALAMVFRLARTLPLFLWNREKHIVQQ